MISFRYLIVTLVAVFLALALGVLAGTTVLDQGLVSTLKGQTRDAERRATAAQGDLAAATSTLSQLQDLMGQAAPYLVQNRLNGQRVVVVTYDGTDPTARNEAVSALQEAGANVLGVLSVTAKMAAADPSSRSDLAGVLGVPVPPSPTPSANASPGASPGSGQLVRQAATQMADRLAVGGRSPGQGHRRPDLLGALLDKGFLKSAVSAGALPTVGGPNQVVLVVTAGGPPPVPISEFLIPLVEALGRHPATWLAVGESAPQAGQGDPLVQGIRNDAALSGDQMVTVDDLDPEHFGGIQLVLGLDSLIHDGRGGNYGIEAGSQGLLPKAG